MVLAGATDLFRSLGDQFTIVEDKDTRLITYELAWLSQLAEAVNDMGNALARCCTACVR